MVHQALADLDSNMQKVADGFVRELAIIRTGRASPAFVEDLLADYHGSAVPLKQLASISIPEARVIMVQPWDRSSLQNIEKAILRSDLSLNPSSDGNVIRVVIPPLSQERRKELARIVLKKTEERRVNLRNLRRATIDRLRQLERKSEISQNELETAVKRIQELTDSFIEKVNMIAENKQREIEEV
jgi:ribosome recycling factor